MLKKRLFYFEDNSLFFTVKDIKKAKWATKVNCELDNKYAFNSWRYIITQLKNKKSNSSISCL